jgi:hypothetical protein
MSCCNIARAHVFKVLHAQLRLNCHGIIVHLQCSVMLYNRRLLGKCAGCMYWYCMAIHQGGQLRPNVYILFVCGDVTIGPCICHSYSLDSPALLHSTASAISCPQAQTTIWHTS